MLWGEQWICECGTHNFILRETCRDCKKSKQKTSIGEKSWVDVIKEAAGEK